MQNTPESGADAGYDGHKRRQRRKTHAAIDTLGHLLTLHVTRAHTQVCPNYPITQPALNRHPERS